MNPDEIKLFQWETSVIHFACSHKGVWYWRTFRANDDCDKWDFCTFVVVRAAGECISLLSYLVITGEHLDIEKVIKEAKRHEYQS